LELAYEISAHIGGGKRAFEVVRNSVIGFVYGVRTKYASYPLSNWGLLSLGAEPEVLQSIAVGRSGLKSCTAMCPLASYIK
jgi:hypothetical protein